MQNAAHPLLAQVPLTVSPFISLPAATTLPYTYKSLPSAMPPSSTGEDAENPKPKYVVSQSGHAAHPDEIITSCQELLTHLKKMQDDAEKTLKGWREDIAARELAEKRRVAPGWLDRDEKILEPAKSNVPPHGLTTLTPQNAGSGSFDVDAERKERPAEQNREGEELDRVFGGMVIK